VRIVLGFDPVGTFVSCHPGRERGQRFIRSIELPQDDTDAGAGKAVVGNGDSGRIRSGRDR
jgi:hypothetical protein